MVYLQAFLVTDLFFIQNNRGKKCRPTVRDRRENTPHLCNIKTKRGQKRLRRKQGQEPIAKNLARRLGKKSKIELRGEEFEMIDFAAFYKVLYKIAFIKRGKKHRATVRDKSAFLPELCST
jgi:hypothetical protein